MIYYPESRCTNLGQLLTFIAHIRDDVAAAIASIHDDPLTALPEAYSFVDALEHGIRGTSDYPVRLAAVVTKSGHSWTPEMLKHKPPVYPTGICFES